MKLKHLLPLILAVLLLASGREPTAPINDPAAPPPTPPPAVTPAPEPTTPTAQPDSLPPIGFPWTESGISDAGYCPLLYGHGWNDTLLWPLPGYAEYRPFGFEPGGRHVGWDIYAPMGTPVLSPVNGVIVWAGWTGAGFGQMVAVASSGRVVILAHLSAVTEGLGCVGSVTAGDVIGAVGRSGAVAGVSHLHLEVRYQGLAWSPGLWLD